MLYYPDRMTEKSEERNEETMRNYTRDDIIRLVEEEDVEFIRLQFTDMFGNLKNIAITASQLDKALDNKCMFDGSAIDGFVGIEESDMYLICPDPFHVGNFSLEAAAGQGCENDL